MLIEGTFNASENPKANELAALYGIEWRDTQMYFVFMILFIVFFGGLLLAGAIIVMVKDAQTWFPASPQAPQQQPRRNPFYDPLDDDDDPWEYRRS